MALNGVQSNTITNLQNLAQQLLTLKPSIDTLVQQWGGDLTSGHWGALLKLLSSGVK